MDTSEADAIEAHAAAITKLHARLKALATVSHRQRELRIEPYEIFRNLSGEPGAAFDCDGWRAFIRRAITNEIENEAATINAEIRKALDDAQQAGGGA